jgi:hypothetical protein
MWAADTCSEYWGWVVRKSIKLLVSCGWHDNAELLRMCKLVQGMIVLLHHAVAV